MFQRFKKSLAYRLPATYRQVLKLKTFKASQKPSLEAYALMMTGKNHIDLLKLCLASIQKNWEYLPKLIVSSDGSLTPPEIKSKLNFWKGELTVQSLDESLKYHLVKGRNALIKYAEINPFGKKLAIILHHAESKPVLWLDSDILFFKDFTPYIPSGNTKDAFMCGGSADWISAYDDRLIKKFKNNLHEYEGFNAGLLYVSGADIYESFNLEEAIVSLNMNFDFLTEQTIFAHISSKSLGIIWPQNIVRNFNSDNLDIKPMPVTNVVARHYTSNIRHLFWRDAFYNL